jgi:hypothetical protein
MPGRHHDRARPHLVEFLHERDEPDGSTSTAERPAAALPLGNRATPAGGQSRISSLLGSGWLVRLAARRLLVTGRRPPLHLSEDVTAAITVGALVICASVASVLCGEHRRDTPVSRG